MAYAELMKKQKDVLAMLEAFKNGMEYQEPKNCRKKTLVTTLQSSIIQMRTSTKEDNQGLYLFGKMMTTLEEVKRYTKRYLDDLDRATKPFEDYSSDFGCLFLVEQIKKYREDVIAYSYDGLK